MRRILATIATFLAVIATGVPAVAADPFEVSAPGSIEYDPTLGGFAVAGIQITGAPTYIQVGLTLTDTTGVQVPANDDFHIAVATRCSFNNSWSNSATGGNVVISGDNSTNVLLAGNAGDVIAALENTWIFDRNSNFCTGSATQKLGQGLLFRNLQVSAIESAPGLFWSPSTQHYYQLATQTTDDGMGQPTDDFGNVTDSSRYFVRWSTARAEAKSAVLSIGGNTHRGYLAAITTRDEFSFLNDNVTGGSGTLYPAWVGGSDAATEGVWKWVDGPEAERFGGDTLTRYIDQQVAPDGRVLEQDSEGSYYLNFPMDGEPYRSYMSQVTFFRDSSGNKVIDPDTGYPLAFNSGPDGGYCAAANNDIWAAWADFNANGPTTEATPYGSYVLCDMQWGWWGAPYVEPKLQDADGNLAPTTDAIYITEWGYPLANADGNYRAVEPNTSDFTQQSGIVQNFEGATFWGPDAGDPDTAVPNLCTSRGIRGVCTQNQRQVDGQWVDNTYYIYWSNGNRSYERNWDGTGVKPGDGVYAPQPDNYNGNNPDGEDALIINWCARNGGVGANSDAIEQSLYGNTGYFCTPGWNDLTAGDWAFSSSTYPNGHAYDTPNQIGTTDYVIEYCGYADEASCAVTQAATAMVSFSIGSQGCPKSGTPNLSVSYSAATVTSTDLSSPTMVTETFDNIPAGWMSDQMTDVGFIQGSTYIGPAGDVGGSGGTGSFPSAVDTTLTLPTTECYLGFWWSAGNAQNYVELMDAAGNVLASFSASDLVNDLGGCPNAYCGNPDHGYGAPGELFAYVHMRLPTGFQKVHFYGQGFEFDNVSISISVPGASSGETFLGGGDPTLVAPEVLLIDPRSHAINLPELQVSGTSTATVCFMQVADSSGGSLSAPTVSVSAPNATGTAQAVGDDFVMSGSNADVQSDTKHLVISSSQRLASGGPIFFKVSASSGVSASAQSCNTGVSRVVEIRPVALDLVSNLVAHFNHQ